MRPDGVPGLSRELQSPALGNTQRFVVMGAHTAPAIPVIMTHLGKTNVGLYENGAACPTTTTCDVFGELSAGTAWNPPFVASYVGSTRRYSLLAIEGEAPEPLVNSMSCDGTTCWLAGRIRPRRACQSDSFFPSRRSSWRRDNPPDSFAARGPGTPFGPPAAGR